MDKLVVKVSATGNLQPTNKVEVSSELSGIVTEVLVDENDRVNKGQVLAQLDLSKLKDAVTKSRATLEAAEAQVLQAQATVEEARAQLARFKQVAELSGGKVPSKSEMATAEANLRRAEANEASARASVTQARANLRSDETNLGKASIRSPIDGVVLTRKIEPGQTVAAALQAPVLFTLAVDVDEADVGQVRVHQEATFTVDAWPGRKYTGVITRVGYGSQTKDNVVSYPTVLAVNNDDLSLRPGMTGTADIVTVTRENVLLVPNAALRFTPAVVGAPAGGSPGGPPGGIVGKLMPRPPSQPPKLPAPVTDGRPRVWVLRGGQAAPIEIQTGATNGQMTEVLGGTLAAGTQVITEASGSQP
jgi:HlyD family secretion protein